jgi:serine/threonine-protein kinase
MAEARGKPQPLIVGRYELHGEIARGGMATVHVGRILSDGGFSRTVAIKRLHPYCAKDPAFAAMFVDEARLASRIHHPNVVSTLDVVVSDEELFVVMEFVQGESLSRLLRISVATGTAIPVDFVSGIGAGVLDGLHAAHEAVSENDRPLGIVHRDVSPQNILVGVDGVPRIIDFGVAKAAGRLQTTSEGQLKGKLGYMPPEQFAGAPADRRGDIYSTAIVIWEALTGQRLFDGQTEAESVGKILRGAIEPPSRHVEGIPPALDEVVMRGLATDPRRRFATAHDMALALERAVTPASARRMGEWVRAMAADSLGERAKQILEIESKTSGVNVRAGIPAEAFPGYDGVGDTTELDGPAADAAAFQGPRSRRRPELAPPSSGRTATDTTTPLPSRVASSMWDAAPDPPPPSLRRTPAPFAQGDPPPPPYGIPPPARPAGSSPHPVSGPPPPAARSAPRLPSSPMFADTPPEPLRPQPLLNVPIPAPLPPPVSSPAASASPSTAAGSPLGTAWKETWDGTGWTVNFRPIGGAIAGLFSAFVGLVSLFILAQLSFFGIGGIIGLALGWVVAGVVLLWMTRSTEFRLDPTGLTIEAKPSGPAIRFPLEGIRKFLILEEAGKDPNDHSVHVMLVGGDFQRIDIDWSSAADAAFVAGRFNEMLDQVRRAAPAPAWGAPMAGGPR